MKEKLSLGIKNGKIEEVKIIGQVLIELKTEAFGVIMISGVG